MRCLEISILTPVARTMQISSFSVRNRYILSTMMVSILKPHGLARLTYFLQPMDAARTANNEALGGGVHAGEVCLKRPQ